MICKPRRVHPCASAGGSARRSCVRISGRRLCRRLSPGTGRPACSGRSQPDARAALPHHLLRAPACREVAAPPATSTPGHASVEEQLTCDIRIRKLLWTSSHEPFWLRSKHLHVTLASPQLLRVTFAIGGLLLVSYCGFALIEGRLTCRL